jgi:GntR family transcriptional regulator
MVMMKKINLDYDIGAAPLYGQVRDHIIECIQNGTFKEKIPTEVELIEMFGVSRATIRQAVDALVSEGYVRRERSRGTKILKKKIGENMSSLRYFHSEMEAQGIKYNMISSEVRLVKSDEKLSEALDIAEGTNLYCIHRVYSLENGEPFASLYSYLIPDLNISVDPDTYKGSLYEYLASEKGIIMTRAREEVEVGFADEENAKDLEIPFGSPLFQRNRVTRDQNDRKVEFVKGCYRPDSYKMSFDLER